MRGDQLARQWQLIQLLARSRRGLTLDELASELECVKRTLYRDLDALMYAGFPVTSERRDGRAYYRFVDRFGLGDAPFTADELLALAFGEDLLRALEGTVFHDSIRSAFAKVRASLGPDLAAHLGKLRAAFQVQPTPHKRYAQSGELIAALQAAVLGSETLRMRYRTAASGEERSRDFDPYRIWFRDGALYAIGLDHRSGEIRTFAVERMRALTRTGRHFEPVAGFDFDAHVAHAFGVVSEAASAVRIRFSRTQRTWIEEREWHPSQKLTPLEDGGVELHMEVGGEAELARWVLSFGEGAEVLEPESLRRRVAREAEATAARYRGQSEGSKSSDSRGRRASQRSEGSRRQGARGPRDANGWLGVKNR